MELIRFINVLGNTAEIKPVVLDRRFVITTQWSSMSIFQTTTLNENQNHDSKTMMDLTNDGFFIFYYLETHMLEQEASII